MPERDLLMIRMGCDPHTQAAALLASKPVATTADYLLATAWPMATDAQLENLSGSSEASTHVAVSFGFPKGVSFNSGRSPETRLHLPDVLKTKAEQAKLLGDALPAPQIFQNGIGNIAFARSSVAGLIGATVVQHSLCNQSIQTLTVIDAGANSQGLLHSTNTQGAPRDALTATLGIR